MSSAAVSKKSGAVPKDIILKEFRQRLKENIAIFNGSLAEILRLAKVTPESSLQETDQLGQRQVSRITQHEQECFEMQVRAGAMCRSAESLLTLISELKTFLVVHDFGYVNSSIEQTRQEFTNAANQQQRILNDYKNTVANSQSSHESQFLNNSTPPVYCSLISAVPAARNSE